MFYVWTVNKSWSASDGGFGRRLFEGTKAECKKYIIGRWGHFPPWAIISTIASELKFKSKYMGR